MNKLIPLLEILLDIFIQAMQIFLDALSTMIREISDM